jgi:hypothetical protein
MSGTTRLVMLPHEPHWYTEMESNEQEVYEMLNWFDRYVKNAKPTAGNLPFHPMHREVKSYRLGDDSFSYQYDTVALPSVASRGLICT